MAVKSSPTFCRDHNVVASLPALQQLTDLVVAYAIWVMLWKVPLLVQHEGAKAVDETTLVFIMYVDAGLLSFQGRREGDPSRTLDATGQESRSSVHEEFDFSNAFDRDTRFPHIHGFQTGSDVVLEHADGIVQAVTARAQRLLADWKPDIVTLRSPLAVVFETYNRRCDGIRLSSKLASVQVVAHSFASSLHRLL